VEDGTKAPRSRSTGDEGELASFRDDPVLRPVYSSPVRFLLEVDGRAQDPPDRPRDVGVFKGLGQALREGGGVVGGEGRFGVTASGAGVGGHSDPEMGRW
jgi:hypothetical protein